MRELIIGGTFLFGALIALAGIYAFFKNLRGDQATLKALGMELSGTGALVIFVMGAVMMLSGFGWATTQQEATTAKEQAATVVQQVATCTQEKAAVIHQAAVVAEGATALAQRNEALLAAISQVSRTQLASQHPELMRLPQAAETPEFRAAIESIERHRL